MKAEPVRGAIRLLLDSHSMIGIVFGALVYMICLSGALAVVADEFELWERPDAPIVRSADPEMLGRAFGDAVFVAREEGMAHALFLSAPTPELPRMTVTAASDKGAYREWNIDSTGHVVPRATARWTDFLRAHHRTLHIRQPLGGWIVGLIGTALLASLFSGLLAHRRIIRDAFRLRWGGSRRLANADLHNRIGVWALPFHFIVALTGSLLGLATLIILVFAMIAFKGDRERAIAALSGPPVIEDARPAPLPDVTAISRNLLLRQPGARIESVQADDLGTRGQKVNLLVAAPGHLTRAEVWSYAGDGRFLGRLGLTDGNVGIRIYGMLVPLHFGTYGGLTLKLVYLLLGLAMAMVVATGVQILLARRRDQGRPLPRWEQLWDAVIWGQPVAMLASALLSMLVAWPPLPVFWATTIAALAMAPFLAAGPGIRQPLRWVLGVGCVLLGGLHGALVRPLNVESVPIDAMLCLCGVAMIGMWAGPRPALFRR